MSYATSEFNLLPHIQSCPRDKRGALEERCLQGWLLDHFPEKGKEIQRFIFLSFGEGVLGCFQYNDSASIMSLYTELKRHYASYLVLHCFDTWAQFYQQSIPLLQKNRNEPLDASKKDGLILSKTSSRVKKTATKRLKNFMKRYFGRGTLKHRMVYIPEGSFVMGAIKGDVQAKDREKPCHTVTLTKSFWIGQTPCSQVLYKAIMGRNPSRFVNNRASRPVERISWCDAVLFCNKLSEKEGFEVVYKLPTPFKNTQTWSKAVRIKAKANGYRLPTEAEWEYCARAHQYSLYSGAAILGSVAWYDRNSNGKAHPSMQKKANPFSLYDMNGNVWEWVWDSLSAYPAGTRKDPGGLSSSNRARVIRGGSWYVGDDVCRTSFRGQRKTNLRYEYQGFRFLRYHSSLYRTTAQVL